MGQTADEGNRRAEDEVRFTRTERKYRPLDGGHPDVQLVRVCQELRPRHALDRRLPRHVAQPYAGDVERDAHNNPDARGTFIGLTMGTTREDMTQAVLEGVAFAIRDSFEVAKSLGIDIKRTKICGGGAKSPLWKKMIANILNISVDVIESEEGPGLGGAMLAAVACGEYASVEEAAGKIVKVIDTVEPDPVLAAKYEERYQQFKQIYPACKPLFDIIA